MSHREPPTRARAIPSMLMGAEVASLLAKSEWHSLSRVTPSAHPTCHCGVESHFESWLFRVNSSPSNKRPHPAGVTPIPPGGVGCSARIAIFSVAACGGLARAGGLKAMQRPCGARLQKFQSLVHSPPLPQPLSTPAGGIRGAQQPYSANALSGVAFTCGRQHSNLPGTKDQLIGLTLSVFTLKVGSAP